MKWLLLGALILALFANTVSAGTYKCTSDNPTQDCWYYKLVLEETENGPQAVWKEDHAKQGEEVQTYQILDELNPSAWEKVSDAPYVPLALTDQVVTGLSETKEVTINPEVHLVKLTNLGDANCTVQLQTTDNPYGVTLLPSSPNYKADELTIKNDRTFSNLQLTFGAGTEGKVKVVEVP